MKKIFGILGTGLLVISNVLMSFGNVSFAISCGEDYWQELETRGCYVLKHYYHYYQCNDNYVGSELMAYKCDAEGGIVDLRSAPLESGQYIDGIGENAFSGTNVTKVIMPSTVEYIGDGAFCSVEREGAPVCGNGIIEVGEECDGENEIFVLGMNDTYMCNNCQRVSAPECGNEILEQGEDCFNCPSDVEANGGNCVDVKSFDNNESLESQLLLKGSLPVQEYDDSDFVVVDFPNGINTGFNLMLLASACAKLHEYTVTFKMENGDVLGTGETLYHYINTGSIPSVPDIDGFIGGWYLGDELFNIDSEVSGNITLVYKYKKGGIEYDAENGWIKVSLGDQEIIVKDRNQGAEKTFNDVDTGDFTDSLNAVGNYYFWGNNTGLDLKQITGPDDIEDIPEGFDHGYLGVDGGNDWTVGSEDTPCNPASGEYLPSPDDWKNLMQLWGKLNGYEVGSDEMGYFFNDLDIDQGGGGKSLNILISAGPSPYNGESLTLDNIGYFSAIEKFSNDLYISLLPSLYLDNSGSINFVDDLMFLPSALNGGKIGYFISNGLMLSNISNLDGFENLVASPVRCFVKPQFELSFEVDGGTAVDKQKIFSGDNAVEPEIQKENAEFLGWYTADGDKFYFTTPITSDITLYAKWQENKPSDDVSNSSDNGYSGGGGGKSSSSTTKTVEKEHTSDEDKTDSNLEEISKRVQDNIVDNNEKGTEDKTIQTPQKVTYIPDSTLPEMEQAYDFSHSYGITTKNSVENAKMNSPLTRIQMAKMLSNYAMNVLGRQPDVSKGTLKFNDVTNKLDKEYDNGVTLSYQLGIMGQNMPNNNFRPNDEVTRAEFVAAFSRMLYGTSDGEYESTSKYYTHHMQKLKKEGIVINTNPSMKEKRGYVMLMLMRSAK